ncbi:MAG: antitoxin [Proteobacteria bacterium]|nr:antitoxin [Pseudomonadota bacterium]
MAKLNKEEKDIFDAFDAGELKRVRGSAREIARHKEYAEASYRKDARINIRLSSRDLRALQAKAMQEGIPYQTLVASVLHKYVDGQLQEATANKMLESDA